MVRFISLLLALAILGCFKTNGSDAEADGPATSEAPLPLDSLDLDLRYAAASLDSNGLHFRFLPPDSIADFRLHLYYQYGVNRADSIRTESPSQGRFRLRFKEYRPARPGMGVALPPGARITPSWANLVTVGTYGRSSLGLMFSTPWNGMRDLDRGTAFHLVYVDTPATVAFDTVGCDGRPVRSEVRFRSRGFYALEASDHPGKPLFKALVPSGNLVLHHGPVGFYDYQKYLGMAKCRDYSAYKQPVVGDWRLDTIWGVQGYRAKYLSLREDDSIISLLEEEGGGRMENRSPFFATDSTLMGRGLQDYSLSEDGDTLRFRGGYSVYVRIRGGVPAPWLHRLRKVRQVEEEFRGITAMATAGERLLLVRSLGNRIEVLRLDSAGNRVDSLGIPRDSCLGSKPGAAVQDGRILWVNSPCGALRLDLETGGMLPGSFHPEPADFESFNGKRFLGLEGGRLWTLGSQGRIAGHSIDEPDAYTVMPPLDAPRGEAPTLSEGRIYGTFINVHVRRFDLAKDTLSFVTDGINSEIVVKWGESLWVLERQVGAAGEPYQQRPFRLAEYRRPGTRPGEWLPLIPDP